MDKDKTHALLGAQSVKYTHFALHFCPALTVFAPTGVLFYKIKGLLYAIYYVYIE